MKIGFCGGYDSYEIIKDAGYDFIEMPVGEVMPHLDDEQYEPKRIKLKQMGIPCLAFNIFVPGSFAIIESYMGDEKEEILQHCKVAIERVADLGGKIIVFGSGKARRIPDGVDHNTGTNILVDFVRDCADIAKLHDVIIAVEHLNENESNILTSVKETGEFVNKVDRENVKILYDTYHMSMDYEDINNLVSVIDNVAHIHIGDREGRTYPHKDVELYNELNKVLKEAEYKGGISVEAKIDDLVEETRLAIDFIKETFC